MAFALGAEQSFRLVDRLHVRLRSGVYVAAKKSAPQRERRRIREVGDSELASLINSLDYDELLTAFVRLSGPERGARPKSIEDAIEWVLGCGRSVKEITETLQRIEAESPKKHCFFGTFVGDVATAQGSLRTAAIRGTKVTHMFTTEHGFMFATAVRIVQAIDREWTGERGHRIGQEVTRQVRHATVVRLDPETHRVTLTFPPLPTGAQEDFDACIRNVLDVLKAAGITVVALPVRACVSALLLGRARRIAISRGNFLTSDARIQVTSLSRVMPINSVLARLLDATSEDRERVEQQINESLQKQTFNTVTLAWVDEKVNTRVDFLSVGAELLFFWGDADRSYTKIDDMLGLLYEIASGFESTEYRDIWGALTARPDGDIIAPHEFANSFNAPTELTERVLVSAVGAGLVEPVYLLKAEEDLLEANGILDWTGDLLSLRKVFTHSSASVDGGDPKNIRVGFRRTVYALEAEKR